MESIIEAVKTFTDNAHGEQKRRYSEERYIVHPVRVMELCRKHTDDVTTLAAALMHDVLEDTPVTEEEMLSFLNTIMAETEAQRTLSLVIDLTDVYIKADYPEMNRKKRKVMEADRLSKIAPDAQTIKYADIIDNAWDFAVNDKDFAVVFAGECLRVLQKMDKGNPALYLEVQATLHRLKAAEL